MNKNFENIATVHTGVLDNKKNKKESGDICKNASNYDAKIKSNVVGVGVPKGITDLYSHVRSNNSEMPDDPNAKNRHTNKIMSNDVSKYKSIYSQIKKCGKSGRRGRRPLQVPDSNAGITLIALIITIIVLLILTGVMLNLTIGENGIFAKGNVAKEETNKQTATEKINLKITNFQVNNYVEKQQMPTLQDLADNFCEDNEIQYVDLASQKVGSLNKIEVGNNNSIFTKLKEYPYEFEINSKLQLASINGVKIAENSNNSEEIEELKSTISKLQRQIDDLKTKDEELTTTNSNLKNRIQAVENSSQLSITTIDITSPSVAKKWSKVAEYPTGFTKDNTVISGHVDDKGTYRVFPYYYNGPHVAMIEKYNDGIYMWVEGVMVNKPAKLFLQKVN